MLFLCWILWWIRMINKMHNRGFLSIACMLCFPPSAALTRIKTIKKFWLLLEEGISYFSTKKKCYLCYESARNDSQNAWSWVFTHFFLIFHQYIVILLIFNRFDYQQDLSYGAQPISNISTHISKIYIYKSYNEFIFPLIF